MFKKFNIKTDIPNAVVVYLTTTLFMMAVIDFCELIFDFEANVSERRVIMYSVSIITFFFITKKLDLKISLELMIIGMIVISISNIFIIYLDARHIHSYIYIYDNGIYKGIRDAEILLQRKKSFSLVYDVTTIFSMIPFIAYISAFTYPKLFKIILAISIFWIVLLFLLPLISPILHLFLP